MVLIESQKREVTLVNIDSGQCQHYFQIPLSEKVSMSTLTAKKKSILSRSVSMPIQLCAERRGHVTTSNTYTI